MASYNVPNYLRANRKRLGLSQEEVGFLLGVNNGAKVCRHERFTRQPSLEAILAYEAVFRRPIREIFNGLFRQVEQEVIARAKELCKRQPLGKGNAQNKRRLATLIGIAER